MKLRTFAKGVTLLFLLSSCDPVHTLILENASKESVEIVFQGNLSIETKGELELMQIEGSEEEFRKLRLGPDEILPIGTVVASYNPKPSDLDLSYLQISSATDTLKLRNRQEIAELLEKVGRLDWRIVYR